MYLRQEKIERPNPYSQNGKLTMFLISGGSEKKFLLELSTEITCISYMQ